MIVENKITMSIDRRGVMPIIDAVQGDENTRVVEISLMNGNQPWTIPLNTSALVRYRKSDGTGGIYNTMEDGSEATTAIGNKITATLAKQVLTVPGIVLAQVELINDGNIISTFTFGIDVQEDPSVGVVESEDYVSFSEYIAEEVARVLESHEFSQSFMVTVRLGEESGPQTADKTFEEIMGAYNAGSEIVCAVYSSTGQLVGAAPAVYMDAYSDWFHCSVTGMISGDPLRFAFVDISIQDNDPAILPQCHASITEIAAGEQQDIAEEYPDDDARARFLLAMNEKAGKLGMNIVLSGAAGYPDENLSDGKSMVKLFTIANGYDELAKIWNTHHKLIYTKGVEKAIDLTSTVFGNDSGHFASDLIDHYFVHGGKTGTTGDKNRLIGCIMKAPGDRQFAAWLCTEEMAESANNNRHVCMKLLMDIAYAKYKNPDSDVSEIEADMIDRGVMSAAVILIPQTANLLNYEHFDFFETEAVEGETEATLDDVAWGGKTYREIFLTGNMFSEVSAITEADNSGWSQYSNLSKPTPTTTQYNTSPNAWNCSGTKSVQMSKDLSLPNGNNFYIACKRKLDSYTSGNWLGIEVYYIGGAGRVISDTVSASNISQDFQTLSHTFTPKTEITQFWIGSGGSANLTGYIDDVVCVNMTELFGSDVPSKEQMNALYENFLKLYKGETVNGLVERYKYEYPVYDYYANDLLDIASNTKVLTAITALDYISDLDEELTIKASDIQPGTGPIFAGGERMTYRDALYAMMLPSSNTCAYAIARAVGNKLLSIYGDPTKRYASKVIRIADAEIGYMEKASNADLDDKMANAGSGNYTKYARDLDAIPGFYNTLKQGAEWCEMFVDWCFVQAFGVEAALELLCQPGESMGAGAVGSAMYYRNKGRFYTSNPKVGDQIYFGTVGHETHTGLVYKVDTAYVYAIEGNTSNGVYRRTYTLDDASIAGYGRPKYDPE